MVNSHGNVVIPIPGEIMAVDTKGRVVSAKGVYDYNLAKDLETINSEVRTNIQNLQNLIDTAGEGGTTNYSELINKPKINNIELEGNVTLEIPDSYTKEQSDALHNALQRSIEGKANASDVYTQQLINSKVKTLEDRISEIEDHSGATFDPTLYYTITQSNEAYLSKGNYLTSDDIAGKVNTSDFNTYKNSSNIRFTNLERYKVSGDTLSETLRNYALKSELPEGTTVDNVINGNSTNPVLNKIIYSALQSKQDTLVSGTNIKALRSNNALDLSLVGNGFINFKTINGNSIFGTDDIKVSTGEGGGENNIIENITVNGDPVPVSETKTAEITISVPTALSELSNDENHNTVSETLITGWNNKIGGNELKTINGQSILVDGNNTNLVVNPANDSNLVHKTGNETIDGTKTFNNTISSNGISYSSSNYRSSDNLWDTNGKVRSLSSIIRVYLYAEGSLTTSTSVINNSSTTSSNSIVYWDTLIKTPELYNTVIVYNNEVYSLYNNGSSVLTFKYVDTDLNSSSTVTTLSEKTLRVIKNTGTTKGYVISFDEVNRSLSALDSDYFTLEATRDNVSIYLMTSDQSAAKTIEVSDDGGKSWHEITAHWTSYANPEPITTLNFEEKILVRGNNSEYNKNYFSSDNQSGLKVSGNIMSLCYPDPLTFSSSVGLTSSNTFKGLFENCKALSDAKDLILPATVLSEGCYQNMFKNTSLIAAPKLPATTLAPYCYSDMFEGTGLTKVPELPATTMANYCYQGMFSSCMYLTQAPSLPSKTLAIRCYAYMFEGCIRLVSPPTLPATSATSGCYEGMFEGCIALTQAPELPATYTGDGCYMNMFKNCTSLVTPPSLPSTNINDGCYLSMFDGCSSLTSAPALPCKDLRLTGIMGGCYSYMFRNCTSLTTAPELPATQLSSLCYAHMFEGCTALTTAPSTLPALSLTEYYTESPTKGCYRGMFKGCENLQKAPELPATKLTQMCYEEMFFGCSKLNYIKCLATDISATDCTNQWVGGGQIVYVEGADEGGTYKPTSNTQYVYTITSTNVEPGIKYSDDFNPYDMSTWPADYMPGYYQNKPEYNYLYYGFVPSGWYLYNTLPALDWTKNYKYVWVSKREYNETMEMWGDYSEPWLLKYIDDNQCGVASTGTFVKGSVANWTVDSINGIPTGWTQQIDLSLVPTTFTVLNTGLIEWNTTEDIQVTYNVNAANNSSTYLALDLNSPLSVNSGDVLRFTHYHDFYYSLDNGQTWTLVTPPFSGPSKITMDNSGSMVFKTNKSISYSKDNGSTWTVSTPTISTPVSISVSSGDSVIFKTNLLNTQEKYCYFSAIGATFDVKGNIMSLIFGDDYIGNVSLDTSTYTKDYACYRLFKYCAGIKDASLLKLPATELSNYCYKEMFMGSGITYPPSILPTTSFPNGATIYNCYESMFEDCTSLGVLPSLPSTNLYGTEYVYKNMFAGCTALNGSLSSVFDLPATKLEKGCYYGMFKGCTNITESPVLPAVSLPQECYKEMFKNCTNLGKITCSGWSFNGSYSTSGTNDTYPTKDWVVGVASTGTFVNTQSNLWIKDSVDGIPSGWTVSGSAGSKPTGHIWVDPEDPDTPSQPVDKSYKVNSDNYSKNYLTIEVLTDGYIYWKTDNTTYAKSLLYSNDLGNNWITIYATVEGSSIMVREGDTIILRGGDDSYETGFEHNFFASTIHFNLSGNINSLINNGSGWYNNLGTKYYTYKGLFKDCLGLISIKNLRLPATPIEGCYDSMFYGCLNLVELSDDNTMSSSTAINCYRSMFENCVKITEAPILPATNLRTGCYSRMFYGCKNLSNIVCYATSIETNALLDWVTGVAEEGIFTKAASTVLPTGNSGIPEGWVIQ